MSDAVQSGTVRNVLAMPQHGSETSRLLVVGVISFLTLVDLFATQAILPSLTRAYGVTPAAMGFAVNASTMGMAAAGLVIAAFGRHINRRLGITASLALLAIPTSLLAMMPDLVTFTALRVTQGIFMSSAFTLTMAYLAEECGAEAAAAALAAYVTGNVASNLFGRLMSAAITDYFGLSANFELFAALNLTGAVLAFVALRGMEPMMAHMARRLVLAIWHAHLTNPALRASFALAFIILFAFLGAFTFVNFVLAGEPIALPQMSLGFIYFVFVPSMLTTPLAGRLATRFGVRSVIIGSLGIAAAGLPLLLVPTLPPILLGLTLVGIGTFLAQATATGFVSRIAGGERGAASGLYLASYYLGGLVGSALLGQVFGHFGWTATILVVGVSLGLGAWFARRMTTSAVASQAA